MKFRCSSQTIILSVITVTAVSVLALTAYTKLYRRARELARVDRMIEQLSRENLRLATEITRAQTDTEYICMLAQRELGFIKPGEIEYRFVAAPSVGDKKHAR